MTVGSYSDITIAERDRTVEGGYTSDASTRASSQTSRTFISSTELSDGRQALLLDIGSWNNLTGTPWARRTAVLGGRAGRQAKQTRRERPLDVSGVGTGVQTCTHDCELPITLKTTDDRALVGLYRAPTVDDNALPALLGLKTLLERRAIIDLTRMQISFTGPGESRIDFSPGTDTFAMMQAPSGHLMLPCCEYGAASSSSSSPTDLILHTSASSSSSASTAAPSTRDQSVESGAASSVSHQ